MSSSVTTAHSLPVAVPLSSAYDSIDEDSGVVSGKVGLSKMIWNFVALPGGDLNSPLSKLICALPLQCILDGQCDRGSYDRVKYKNPYSANMITWQIDFKALWLDLLRVGIRALTCTQKITFIFVCHLCQ